MSEKKNTSTLNRKKAPASQSSSKPRSCLTKKQLPNIEKKAWPHFLIAVLFQISFRPCHFCLICLLFMWKKFFVPCQRDLSHFCTYSAVSAWKWRGGSSAKRWLIAQPQKMQPQEKLRRHLYYFIISIISLLYNWHDSMIHFQISFTIQSVFFSSTFLRMLITIFPSNVAHFCFHV